MLDKLTINHFSRHLNETFSLRLEGPESLTLALIDVAPLGTPPEDTTARQAFSVIFRGPEQPILQQQIYDIAHADFGTLTLFLVPLGPDRTDGIRYEAVFT
jgi:hypothetical protein